MIQFKETEIGYNKPLIKIPELKLISGEIYALIGANGSGKTTFLNCLIGKMKLMCGDLTIDGKSSTHYSSKKLARKIAFVESKFDGVDFLTVRDYISLGRAPYTDAFGRLNSSDRDHVAKALRILQLDGYSERLTKKLSDGERQLTAIARALAQTTPIIILDEPTAFLDYGNRKKLIETLSQLAKEEGKCIIFSTHDIELCLDEKLTLLIVNQENKILEQYSGEIEKSVVLLKGFGITQE